MDRGVGFNRNIKLDWLDTAAAFCVESSDAAAIRARLEPVIRQEIASPTNIRKAIDILLNIWLHTPSRLRESATRRFHETPAPADRLWLHYGLTLAAYPFFFNATSVIGQLARHQETFTTADVRRRLAVEMGQLGSLEKAALRVTYSLRDWGILLDGGQRNRYRPYYRAFSASSTEVEVWLLACALHAHPAEELPFPDLISLPALFPFRLTVTAGDLRRAASFELQRQGIGLDMVRAAGRG